MVARPVPPVPAAAGSSPARAGRPAPASPPPAAGSGPAQPPPAARGRLTIDRPGVYDISDADYHADPVPGGSLSSTGARRLLPPSCPAIFRYELDHPRETAAFDLGKAAHLLVLGAGAELVIIAEADWRKKAAQEARDAARKAGKIPLLAAEHEQVLAMAAALRGHPIASALFDPGRGGRAEKSLFWEADGIWKRARLDWLPLISDRPIVADYKTARSADPGSFAKAVANFGYHVQAAHYLEGLQVLTGAHGAFVFAVQEKEPPYLVTVCELDATALRIGKEQGRRAAEIYRDCKEAGVWPGYSTDIELISLPPWAARAEEYA